MEDKVLVDGEQAYPIYRFDYKWSQDGEQDSKRSWQHDGLPLGRIWNSTSVTKIYNKKLISGFLEHESAKFWNNIKHKYPNPLDCVITAVFKEYETWCLQWFSHYTFDVGQTDGQILESFEKFVHRKLLLNEREGQWINGYWREPYCLMGAEDRWRWRSSDDGRPPCRCEGCKRNGIVRIDH